jgi:hypothetical protein
LIPNSLSNNLKKSCVLDASSGHQNESTVRKGTSKLVGYFEGRKLYYVADLQFSG